MVIGIQLFMRLHGQRFRTINFGMYDTPKY
uniref:Uncharacterized protein n=1 Tax=Arundo donax TaxID=35708 RepID=A0A0A8ZZ19_ARUDO